MARVQGDRAQPAVEPWVGVMLFGALAAVPFITAYRSCSTAS